jgi:hypothetical protein
MRRLLVMALLAVMSAPTAAQKKVAQSGGEVALHAARANAARLTDRVSGADSAQLARIQVGGDSAQRIAMHDYAWRGRVRSVEFDSADSRVFWDVKIVPDGSPTTVVRYRVDALVGGIMDIREFTGVRRLTRRGKP